MFSSWKRKINKAGSKSFPEHHLSGGQGSSSHEITNTTSCADSDYCSTPVEAAELLALAKHYEKQLLSKHQQQESAIFDTSNYIHVLSSLDDEHIPVYRLALRRSKGLEDMFLSIVPDECCQMSEDDSSAMLQSLDEIAASALEILYTCDTVHPVNNCVTKAPPPLPPTIVNSLYEPLTERNTNNSTPEVKHRSEDSAAHLQSTLMLPHSSSSTNEQAVRSILLRPNNNADPKKPKQLKRVQFTASSLEHGNVKNNKSSTSECSSTTGSADLNNSAREPPTSNEIETNANLGNTNNIRCVSTPLPSSYKCSTYLNYKDGTDTHTELSNDSSGEDDSSITGALSTNGSNLSADPNNSERTPAFAPFCSLPTTIVTTGSGACTVLGVEKQLCALFSENGQQAAYINTARESLPGKASDLMEDRSGTATAGVDLKLDGGGDGRRATKVLHSVEHGCRDNRCSDTDFEFRTEPQRYSLPTAKRNYASEAAAAPVSAYNSALVRFSIEGDETFDDVRAFDLGASTTNDSSVGTESYTTGTTEDTATATGFAMESASYSCSSQEEEDDDATKNTEDESRDDSEFSWNASFPSKEFINETDSSCGTTIMEYSDSSNDVSSGASARMLSLNLIERDAVSAVDATSTKVVPSRFLDVGVVNQPPTASSKPHQIVTAATTKDYSWGMLSPKRLLSLNKNHRQPSIRDVVENTTIRPSADTGLDWTTSRKLSRSNSPCPKYLTKTIMKGGGANE